MELLPLVVVYILALFCILGFFALMTYLYFRIKKRNHFLNEQFSPEDSVDDPYMTMPLHTDNSDYTTSFKTPKQSHMNFNLAKMRNTIKSPLTNSVHVPQLNNRISLQTTGLEDSILPQQKFQYISKLINYRGDKLQLYTYNAQIITNKKTFRQLKWENHYDVETAKEHVTYNCSDQGFDDLMDIFKLEKDDYKSVKFIVQIIVKDCVEEKSYYINDLPKTEKVETITEIQFHVLKNQLNKL